MIEPKRESEFEHTMLLISTRRNAPTGNSLRPAHARSQTKEDRRRGDIAHRNVGDGDVFEQRAIDGFERQSLAAFEHAVGDGDVLEPAVRLRPELDAADPFNLLTWNREA